MCIERIHATVRRFSFVYTVLYLLKFIFTHLRFKYLFRWNVGFPFREQEDRRKMNAKFWEVRV